QAAEQNRQRSADREAEALLHRALALVNTQSDGRARDAQEMQVRIALGNVVLSTRGWGTPELETHYRRALALSDATGSADAGFRALWYLWFFFWAHGARAQSAELASDLWARATSGHDSGLTLQACHANWVNAFSAGRLRDCLRYAEQGRAIYDARAH